MTITREEFASSIKEKYPQYKDMDDNELVDKMLEKYPKYKEQIYDSLWTRAKRWFMAASEEERNILWGWLWWLTSWAANVLWFWLDVVWNLPWASKEAWEKVRQLWQKWEEAISWFFSADKESLFYKGGKLWAEVFWASKLKTPAVLTEAVSSWKLTSSVAKLATKYWTAFAEKFPKLTPVLKKALSSSKDWAKFWIVEKWTEEDVAEYAAMWAWFSWAWQLAWAWVKKFWPSAYTRLQLADLITPSKLKIVWTKLEQVGEKLPETLSSSRKTAEWMIDRDIKWSTDVIINKLEKHHDKATKIFNENLSSVKATFQDKRVEQWLNELIKELEPIWWLEKETKVAKNLYKKYKKDWLTLTEINDVKKMMDDAFWIFTVSWEYKSANIKRWLWNIRKDVKKFIEKTWEEFWVKWIKHLNNEKAVSRALVEWIKTKDETSAVRDLAFHLAANPLVWWALWAAWWVVQWQDVSWIIKSSLGWAAAMSVLWSKRIKTNMASIIKKLSDKQKNEIKKFDWAKYLPEDMKKQLNK